MAISDFEKQEIEKQKKLLDIKAKIQEAEEQRLNGLPSYTHDEVKLRFASSALE